MIETTPCSWYKLMNVYKNKNGYTVSLLSDLNKKVELYWANTPMKRFIEEEGLTKIRVSTVVIYAKPDEYYNLTRYRPLDIYLLPNPKEHESRLVALRLSDINWCPESDTLDE